MLARRLGQTAQLKEECDLCEILDDVAARVGGMEDRLHAFVRRAIEDKLKEVPGHAGIEIHVVGVSVFEDEHMDEEIPDIVMSGRGRHA